MVLFDETGLLLGAVALGAVHGVEPGHGWPVAASYALDQANKWVYGFLAGLIIGVGHLVSSIAMVLVFFYAKAYFDLTQVNDPITVLGGVRIGGPVSLVAGVLLIALGVREYTRGHSHGHGNHQRDDDRAGADPSHDHDQTDHNQQHADHGHADHGHTDHGHDHADHGHDHADHGHDHADHGHSHEHSHTDHSHAHDHDDHHTDHEHSHDRDDHHTDHDHDRDTPSHDHSHDRHPDQGNAHTDRSDGGALARLRGALPFGGGHSHSHAHGGHDEAADRGLLGIASFAFLLGFAHEEEFEIIALCAGSTHCLELMLAYALTVVVGIVGLTMLLIAGYQHSEERVEQYTPYLPVFSAIVLVVMGVGFIAGVF